LRAATIVDPDLELFGEISLTVAIRRGHAACRSAEKLHAKQ
jgi:hypothetical protein